MKLEKGTLVVTETGKNKPPRIQVEIAGKRFNPARGEISQTVLDRLKQLNGKEVEFEMVGGQPKRIREAGGEFVPPGAAAPAVSQSPGRAQQGRRPERGPASTQPAQQSRRREFHNPYNFVPAPPRKVEDRDLGDSAPPCQDLFLPGLYTGCIRVRMTAVTPLVLPDPENRRVGQGDHPIFPVRLDAEGKPLVPASSVRGMLRSAYEAITNSRFCRFSEEYKSRLAYRRDAREGLKMIPARISGGQIHLLTGTSKIKPDGSPDGPMYAAWLPYYRRAPGENEVPKYADGTQPHHGDHVSAWVELFQHNRWNDERGRHEPDFSFWRVRAIARNGEELGPRPAPSETPRKVSRPWYQGLGDIQKIEGWVCVTNRNINRKHDERVFFQGPNNEKLPAFPLTEELRRQWRELIENYQRLHADAIARRRREGRQPEEYLGHEPGQTGWSRHVYDSNYQDLREGTLCYARLSSDKKKVEALFPVMISRELYPVSPWDLLDPSLRPAARIEELSPADRVFGWVRTERPGANEPGRVAARGLVRVGPVHCLSTSEEALESFQQPLPLAILSTPKPQQGRFNVAAGRQGDAQDDGLSKAEAGYSPCKGLRGRKVYPHQANLPTEHWKSPLEDRTQKGPPYQEYRRPQLKSQKQQGQKQQDNQNRSIEGWIKPGAKFEFDLYVENLSSVELGALLWLLKLPEGHYLRFGGGRPLGFGSVRLELKACDLRTPEGLRVWYSRWLADPPGEAAIEHAIQQFKQAVVRAYGEGRNAFEQVSFIKAFLVACRGFADKLPVHYPRVTKAPDPDGENFRWFVENERQGRYALRDLVNDPGLPLLGER